MMISTRHFLRRYASSLRGFTSMPQTLPKEELQHHMNNACYFTDIENLEEKNRDREILDMVKSHVSSGDTSAVQIVRLDDVRDSLELWKRELPRVTPFYAVKCNPDSEILSLLASMDTGFDAASVPEIEAVLDKGVDPNRVIYANPIKQISHLKRAAEYGVNTTTFDSLEELDKIATYHPNANLMLRLKPDDSMARCRLGQKFGSNLGAVPALLKRATELNLKVIGVSFHVGSGNDDVNSWRKAVDLARAAFDINAGQHEFSVLNIGGGFPACSETFSNIASVVRERLDARFSNDVRIIAEPGRMLVEKSHSLLVNVIGLRTSKCVMGVQGEEDEGPMYFVNDGLYGSFNCVLYDHAELQAPRIVKNGSGEELICNDEKILESTNSSIWGHTCDGLDCIMPEVQLPSSDIEVGDWMIFESMGAYTTAAASSFNGFKKSNPKYIF